MTTRIPGTVFTLCVSMADWTYCPDEHGPFLPNADLKAALEAMHINLNLCDLCDYYFDDIAVGTGDVLIFTSSRFADIYFIANLYRDMTDQLDIVTFYVSCPHQEIFKQIKPYLRSFFDHASCQIAYEERNISVTADRLAESKSGDIYRVIEETGYQQKVIFHSGSFAD